MKRNMLQNLGYILRLSCEDASKLSSESLDRPLLFSERWALRLHVLGCYSCRHFQRQLELLSKAAKRLRESTSKDDAADATLPSGLKSRLHQLVDDRQSSSN